jgi:hypothetical protein
MVNISLACGHSGQNYFSDTWMKMDTAVEVWRSSAAEMPLMSSSRELS